jgi:hypothetical protein
MAVLLNPPEQHWVCPNCSMTDVTHLPPGAVVTRMHDCAGLKGLSAPFVPEGTRAKVEAQEREDYVGDELPQFDGDGRPIMAVVTTRDEGQDCAVLAPTARVIFR